uniref:Uncharacterized protein n=1 Tax=Oryza nivara TaxID=4536 RepID=A0A0E0GPS0_ORYNI
MTLLHGTSPHPVSCLLALADWLPAPSSTAGDLLPFHPQVPALIPYQCHTLSLSTPRFVADYPAANPTLALTKSVPPPT